MILIAERDQNVRALQLHFLTRAGFNISFVDDGEAALVQTSALSPVMVITEILIPRIDGLALCRRLQDDPRTAPIPVIVFSILAAETRAREAGARGFLRKPIVESTFIAMVQQVIATQQINLAEGQWSSK